MRLDPTLTITAASACRCRSRDYVGSGRRPLSNGSSLLERATVRSGKRGPLGAWGGAPPNTPFFLSGKKPSVFGFFLNRPFGGGGSR